MNRCDRRLLGSSLTQGMDDMRTQLLIEQARSHGRREGAAFTAIIFITAIFGCICAGWELTCTAGILLGACEIGRRCVA